MIVYVADLPDFGAPVPPSSFSEMQHPTEVERLKAQIEGMSLYVCHEAGCGANDLDYLDKSPCKCGLRKFYNPKGLDDAAIALAQVKAS